MKMRVLRAKALKKQAAPQAKYQYIIYGASTWAPDGSRVSERLERALRRAIRA